MWATSDRVERRNHAIILKSWAGKAEALVLRTEILAETELTNSFLCYKELEINVELEKS